jgi:hypothetical protein
VLLEGGPTGGEQQRKQQHNGDDIDGADHGPAGVTVGHFESYSG